MYGAKIDRGDRLRRPWFGWSPDARLVARLRLRRPWFVREGQGRPSPGWSPGWSPVETVARLRRPSPSPVETVARLRRPWFARGGQGRPSPVEGRGDRRPWRAGETVARGGQGRPSPGWSPVENLRESEEGCAD
jgi:hypothetical protein